MNCFVTGAAGFIGANLVHELVARGHRVKALVRPNGDLRGLVGAECELIEGDINDRTKLAGALRGCDWCFHVAASYHLWLRDYAPMYATNVAGTVVGTTTTSPGNTATSPQPMGTLMSMAWCSVRLVGAEGRWW